MNHINADREASYKSSTLSSSPHVATHRVPFLPRWVLLFTSLAVLLAFLAAPTGQGPALSAQTPPPAPTSVQDHDHDHDHGNSDFTQTVTAAAYGPASKAWGGRAIRVDTFALDKQPKKLLRVYGLKRGSKVQIDWGDGTKTERKFKKKSRKCRTAASAKRFSKKCSLKLGHRYEKPRSYGIWVKVDTRLRGYHGVTVTENTTDSVPTQTTPVSDPTEERPTHPLLPDDGYDLVVGPGEGTQTPINTDPVVPSEPNTDFVPVAEPEPTPVAPPAPVYYWWKPQPGENSLHTWQVLSDRGATFEPCSTVTWYFDRSLEPDPGMYSVTAEAFSRISTHTGLTFTETFDKYQADFLLEFQDQGVDGPAGLGGPRTNYEWDGWHQQETRTGWVGYNIHHEWATQRWASFDPVVTVTEDLPDGGLRRWTWPGNGWLAVHEIMHGLGIDHSPDPGDVMYSSTNAGENTGFSANDIAALNTMYLNNPCPPAK